ncbi:Zinc/iron permease [Kockiozyma suomiensis]|uniref:Zinc/iron permease n=1 Tax=Kockiozyma suomiensis TaxID=1337062 RepID=UPI00334313A6
MADSCLHQAPEHYVLHRRITSIFAVLVVSAIAVFSPLLLQQYVKAGAKSEKTTKKVLMILKQFGAGVIVATAFVHLLPDAFDAFQDPCIGELKFDAWPGFLAMTGVMITFLVENVGHRIVSEKIRRIKQKLTKRSVAVGDANGNSDAENAPLLPTTSTEDLEHHELENGISEIANNRQPAVSSHSHTHGHALHPNDSTHVHVHGHTIFEIESDESDDEVAPDGTIQQGALSKQLNASIDRLSLYVLEAGVIFHSVLIGITLSVTNESAWVSLFTVVLFHQFFEGMALGTRIMSVRSISTRRKRSLCAWFCLITPIGMSIGLIFLVKSSSAATSSVAALWTMGTLNSLSAGILLWVSLVELLAEEWIHGDLHDAPVLLSTAAFMATVSGAGLMSILGVWI